MFCFIKSGHSAMWLANDLGEPWLILALKVPVPSCKWLASLYPGLHWPTRVVPPCLLLRIPDSQLWLLLPGEALPGQAIPTARTAALATQKGQSNHKLVLLYTCIVFIAQYCAGLQDLYRQPLSNVYSLSEKYRMYKPQYYQL